MSLTNFRREQYEKHMDVRELTSNDDSMKSKRYRLVMAARRGEVTIRGRREINRDIPWEAYSVIWERIEPRYWENHFITLNQTRQIGGVDYSPKYTDLLVET